MKRLTLAMPSLENYAYKKDVSIKGALYSREFNQRFKADGAICSIKQDTNGKFNLSIDSVSHVS